MISEEKFLEMFQNIVKKDALEINSLKDTDDIVMMVTYLKVYYDLYFDELYKIFNEQGQEKLMEYYETVKDSLVDNINFNISVVVEDEK